MKIYYANPETRKWEEYVEEKVDLRKAKQKPVPKLPPKEDIAEYHAPTCVVKRPDHLHEFSKVIEATNLTTLEKFIIYGPHHLADLGFSRGCVSQVCNGKAAYHKNHTFRYI